MANPIPRFHIILSINPLTTTLQKIGKVWSEGMGNNAEKIDDRRKESISDEVTYLSKIAEPSEQEFRRVLDPTFISRSGKGKSDINAVQAHKIKKSWRKYQRNWDHQFEDGAKRFKDKVKAAQDTYAERVSETTLAFTGVKSLESGPVRIAVYWLTGDPKAKGLIRPSDRIILPSEPFNISTPAKRNTLRVALNSRLIQSGMTILHHNLNATVLTAMNTLNNEVAQGFVSPALGIIPFAPGADSHLDYIVQNGQLFLSVKVR